MVAEVSGNLWLKLAAVEVPQASACAAAEAGGDFTNEFFYVEARELLHGEALDVAAGSADGKEEAYLEQAAGWSLKAPLEVAEDLTGPGLRPWIFGSQPLLRSFEEEGQGQPNTGSPGQCVLLYDVGKSKVEEGNLGEQDVVVTNAAVLEVELAGCVCVCVL